MKILALLLLLLPLHAFACNVDADCQAGAQCVKPYGQPPGICKGGHPGNKGYPPPAQQPEGGGAGGAVCNSDSDCGDGARCRKGRGQAQGVCTTRPQREASDADDRLAF